VTFVVSGAARHSLEEVDLMLKIGQKAPEFTLPSEEGKEVSLKDFLGRRVLIFFFPKANTPG
jgi:peroxiredoxin Q/BCP